MRTHEFINRRANYTRAPRTIPKVTIKKYLGIWHQIAAFPAFFLPNDAKEVTATYSLNKDGSIKVLNAYMDPDGKKHTATATGTPVDKTNSKLKVDFGFPSNILGAGDYWILYTDYNTSIVGTPDRKYLWILSRKKSISKERMDLLYTIVKREGYDTSKLK
jgi:apolipoprotein D and lipocalin family protein